MALSRATFGTGRPAVGSSRSLRARRFGRLEPVVFQAAETVLTTTIDAFQDGLLPLNQVHPLVAEDGVVWCVVCFPATEVAVYQRAARGTWIRKHVLATDVQPVGACLAIRDGLLVAAWVSEDYNRGNASNTVRACFFTDTGADAPFDVSLPGETYCQSPSVCFDEFGYAVFAYGANSEGATFAQIQLVQRHELSMGMSWFVRRTVSGVTTPSGVYADTVGKPARFASVAAAAGMVVVAYKYEGQGDFDLNVYAAGFVNPGISTSGEFEPLGSAADETPIAGPDVDVVFDPVGGSGAGQLAAHDPSTAVSSAPPFVVVFHRPDRSPLSGGGGQPTRRIYQVESADGYTWSAPAVVPGRYRQPTPAHIYSQFANVSLSPSRRLGGFVTWECNNQPVLTLGDLQVYGCTLDALARPDDESGDLADRGEAPYAGWPSVYVDEDGDVHLLYMGADAQATGSPARLLYRRYTP